MAAGLSRIEIEAHTCALDSPFSAVPAIPSPLLYSHSITPFSPLSPPSFNTVRLPAIPYTPSAFYPILHHTTPTLSATPSLLSRTKCERASRVNPRPIPKAFAHATLYGNYHMREYSVAGSKFSYLCNDELQPAYFPDRMLTVLFQTSVSKLRVKLNQISKKHPGLRLYEHSGTSRIKLMCKKRDYIAITSTSTKGQAINHISLVNIALDDWIIDIHALQRNLQLFDLPYAIIANKIVLQFRAPEKTIEFIPLCISQPSVITSALPISPISHVSSIMPPVLSSQPSNTSTSTHCTKSVLNDHIQDAQTKRIESDIALDSVWQLFEVSEEISNDIDEYYGNLVRNQTPKKRKLEELTTIPERESMIGSSNGIMAPCYLEDCPNLPCFYINLENYRSIPSLLEELGNIFATQIESISFVNGKGNEIILDKNSSGPYFSEGVESFYAHQPASSDIITFN